METSKEPRQRIADDLLVGAPAIAEELGTTQRQVYHLAATKRVPIGRWGKKLFAFRKRAPPRCEGPHRRLIQPATGAKSAGAAVMTFPIADMTAVGPSPAKEGRPPNRSASTCTETEVSQIPAYKISGKKLAHEVRRMPAHRRAKLAFDLIAGRVELRGLTVQQARALTKAPLAELNDLRRSTAGCSLREQQRRQYADRLVARIGAEGIMAALDRMTSPQRAAAE